MHALRACAGHQLPRTPVMHPLLNRPNPTALHSGGAGWLAGAGRRNALLIAALLGALTMLALARPLLPIDETRYAAVAWEMWSRGDFVVPHLNGEPYPHKPPLLFWLVHAGWAVFGVSQWWPRLIAPAFTAATLALTGLLARGLWPQQPNIERIAPFVLLASAVFTYFAGALMFDPMLCAFVVLGFVGLVRAWRSNAGSGGFVLLALGLTGALFAKGPVALIHLLPAALLAPWWMCEQRPPWPRWYARAGLALLAAALAILAWALPAAAAGGAAYRDAIFWGQSAGRMVSSFAHVAPWWLYAVSLPLMLAPWLLWPRLWRGLVRLRPADSGTRLLVLSLVVAFVFFSLISGKRWHYLLPEFALFALLAARALAPAPAQRGSMWVPALQLGAMGVAAMALAVWAGPRLGGFDDAPALFWSGAVALGSAAALAAFGSGDDVVHDVQRLALAALVTWSGLLVGTTQATREAYNMHPLAQRLAQSEREQRPVAIVGSYHGQWTFAGRLERPLTVLAQADAVAPWLASHPRGRVVFVYRQDADVPAGTRVEYARRYRGAWVALLAAPQPVREGVHMQNGAG
jgi:4-amino-4-deoxy-L-arabinose transferase-like glycosyltransferase